MFRNMRMRTRLILLGAIASGLLLVPIGTGLYELHNLKANLVASLYSARNQTDAVVAVETAHVAFKTQVQEWKNILIRGNDAPSFDTYLAKFGEEEGKVQANLKKATLVMRQEGVATTDVESLIKTHEELGTRYRDALKSFDKGDLLTGHAVDKLVKGMDRPTTDGMKKMVDLIEKHSRQSATEQIERADVLYKEIRTLLIAFGVAGLIVLIGISTTIIRSLLVQLGGEPAYAADIAQRISSGDLTVDVQVRPGDNASLLASMRKMQGDLRNMVAQVLVNATKLGEATKMLASSTQEVSRNSRDQSEAASSMASAVEELTVGFSQVSSNATEAHSIAQHAGELSKQGGTVVQNAVEEMNKIADAVNQSSQVIVELGENSSQISAIVNTIKEIADQTNLLALNAAIEAARAGEQGRGFAVVADEVRKLAERTAQSTHEISTMIETIQIGTQHAVASMQTGSSRVSEGVAMANRAGESMNLIRDGANQVVAEVNDITAALSEQSAAGTQLAQEVERVAQMAEETSATIDKISNATLHLEQLAGTLQDSVSRFKV